MYALVLLQNQIRDLWSVRQPCAAATIWIAEVDPLRPPVFAAWNGVDLLEFMLFFSDPFKQSFELNIQRAIMLFTGYNL